MKNNKLEHQAVTPPRWANRFLKWYCTPALLDEIEGDLHEIFFVRVKKYGLRKAQLLYMKETILDKVEALLIPEDLQEEFTHFQGAREFFDSLSKSTKKGLLYWVISAKREETRQKRILEIAESTSKKLKPKPFR